MTTVKDAIGENEKNDDLTTMMMMVVVMTMIMTMNTIIPITKLLLLIFSWVRLVCMGSSFDSFLLLLQDLNFDKLVQKRIFMKTINIAIRTSYFIFCQRNKP